MSLFVRCLLYFTFPYYFLQTAMKLSLKNFRTRIASKKDFLKRQSVKWDFCVFFITFAIKLTTQAEVAILFCCCKVHPNHSFPFASFSSNVRSSVIPVLCRSHIRFIVHALVTYLLGQTSSLIVIRFFFVTIHFMYFTIVVICSDMFDRFVP